jgi:hypothetical protein
MQTELNGPYYIELDNFEIQFRILNSNNLYCLLSMWST